MGLERDEIVLIVPDHLECRRPALTGTRCLCDQHLDAALGIARANEIFGVSRMFDHPSLGDKHAGIRTRFVDDLARLRNRQILARIGIEIKLDDRRYFTVPECEHHRDLLGWIDRITLLHHFGDEIQGDVEVGTVASNIVGFKTRHTVLPFPDGMPLFRVVVKSAKYPMRNWIDLVENFEDITLYHGTSIESIVDILSQGTIRHREGIDGSHNGVSFTSDLKIAWDFAHSDMRDGDFLHTEILGEEINCRGSVLVFHDQTFVSQLENLQNFNDGLESEWRSFGDVPASVISHILVHRKDLERYVSDFERARNAGYSPSWFTEREWMEYFNTGKVRAVENLMANPLIRFVS